jgi:hypothetical protein
MLDLIVAIVILTALFGLLGRIGSEGATLTALFARHHDLGWPRGVQEEDPAPWQLERLSARRARSEGTVVEQRAGRLNQRQPTGLASR